MLPADGILIRSNERLSPSSSCDIASLRLKLASSENAFCVVAIPVFCVMLFASFPLPGGFSYANRCFFEYIHETIEPLRQNILILRGLFFDKRRERVGIDGLIH